MDVFFILLKMAWDWMLDRIGGYTGLVAFALLVAMASLGVAHIARFVRRVLARKEQVTQQAEDVPDELDADAAIAEVEYMLGLRGVSE